MLVKLVSNDEQTTHISVNEKIYDDTYIVYKGKVYKWDTPQTDILTFYEVAHCIIIP